MTDARILLVDDEEANIRLLKRILHRAGYEQTRSTTDPRDTLDLYQTFRPDLIVLDLMMPQLSGFDVLEQLSSHVPDEALLPVLVLTGDESAEAEKRALSAGARDFLTKPFSPARVLLRIENMLEARSYYMQLRDRNIALEDAVEERTQELEKAHLDALERLALAAEFRDGDTGEHTRRVGLMSARLAEELGVQDEDVDLIRHAAPLHDVGKIGVPDAILLKPGELTPEEFENVKMHTSIGARVLAGSSSPLLGMAEEIALTHHERWDGSGYPFGLEGESIPIAGRIVGIVDVFDAVTHERPYKIAWPVEFAVDEIRDARGQHFDPEVADAFLALQDAGEFPIA